MELLRSKEKARSEGLELGRQQAKAELEKALTAKNAEIAKLLATINLAWGEETERLQHEMSEFAFVAVNRMLADALRDPQVAMAAVRQVLKECNAWQSLTLEVHPQDAQLIRVALESDADVADRAMKVVGSDEVTLGGCRIASEQGQLDARLEAQLAQLRQSLDVCRARRQTP